MAKLTKAQNKRFDEVYNQEVDLVKLMSEGRSVEEVQAVAGGKLKKELKQHLADELARQKKEMEDKLETNEVCPLCGEDKQLKQ